MAVNSVDSASIGKWLWLCAFAYVCLAASSIQFLILPFLLPHWHAGEGLLVSGDWLPMHESALALAHKIRTLGWAEWTLWPAPRGWIESGVAGTLYALFTPKPWVLIPLNAFIHATSALVLYEIFLPFVSRKKIALFATLPFLLFPTNLLWNTQIHKDGAAILGCFLFLYGWLGFANYSLWKTSKRLLWRASFSISIGFLILSFARPYMMEVVNIISWVIGPLTIGVILRQLIFKKLRFVQVAHFSLLLLVTLTANKLIKSKGAEFSAISDIAVSGLNEIPMTNNAMPDVGAKKDNSGTSQPIVKDIGFPVLIYLPDKVVLIDKLRINYEQGSELIKKLQVLDPQLTSLPLEPPPKVFWVSPPLLSINWKWTPGLPRQIDQKLVSVSDIRKGYLSYLTAKSNIDTEIIFHSAKEMLKYIPRAFQIVLFSPFPAQWFEEATTATNSVFRRIVGAEMSFLYLFFPFFLYAFVQFYRRLDFLLICFFSGPIMLLYSIVAPNFGTLHRFRYGCSMTLVGFGIIGFSAFRQKYLSGARTITKNGVFSVANVTAS